MKLDIDAIMANMLKDEEELKAVQKKHRQIIAENVAKEK